MMVPDDVGVIAFHGDAEVKARLLERLQGYEAQGDTELKMEMLQEKWNDRAQNGIVLNPYPKIVQREDIAGLRISGDLSTLYALGKIQRSQLFLLEGNPESRIYVVNYFYEDAFHKGLGIPVSLMSVLKAVSEGLPPEQQIPWLRRFWAAIPIGASLWQVPIRLVLWALSDPSHGILGLNNADAQVGEADRGIQAVRDFLVLYRRWQAGDKAEALEWFSFYTQAESSAKSGERDALLAAACAARAAAAEATLVGPLPAGALAVEISGDNLRATGGAIAQAGLYASRRGIVSSVWYETCASVLLDILTNCPVLDRQSK